MVRRHLVRRHLVRRLMVRRHLVRRILVRRILVRCELGMSITSRISTKRRAAIAITALLIGLTPGLAGTASAAKGTTATSTSTRTTAKSNAGNSMATVVTQIGADDMWAAGYTGDGVDVAVIDTGVAPVAELSTTDVFVGPDLSFESGVDEVAGLDTYGHGTHMIGIIAGRTPGADPLHPKPNDFIGVAPDAGIVSVKVADNTGAVDVSQVIAAIDWVVQNRTTNGLNIRVLNLSYNTTGTQRYVDDPLSKAIENAWNHGIVVVVSAGNEGRAAYGLANPATNPKVLAVSAAELFTGYGWGVPAWAPSGDTVRNPDLIAPGVSIASLRVPGSRIDIDHPGGRVTGDDRLFLGSGTSQAAAVTSGAVALLLEQRPELTPDQVKGLLNANAAPVFEKVIFKGHGLLDLAAAMKAPSPTTTQTFTPATGLGTLEASRGTDHVTIGDTVLTGEYTVTGAAWDPKAWVQASEAGTAWSGDDDWSGSTWSGSTWSGSTWSGSTWSGSTWSGSTWSGSTWSGSTWSGSTWSGSTWSGSSWS
jgi:serine protease AprX